MGRKLRPSLAGVPFHVTARIQGRAPAFLGIERHVEARILAARARSDAHLLAWAVMPNHLHLVVLQGKRPLGALMQPMLRRIALLVQRRQDTDGHVFQGPYFAMPCADPEYFRNAIAYVHLNAVRAGLCASADQYPWCSHGRYRALGESLEHAGEAHEMESALRLFARRDGATLAECRRDYLDFLEWRVAADAHKQAEQEGNAGPAPEPPRTLGGDLHWERRYGAAALPHATLRPNHRMDLRDIARTVASEADPPMDLELLRSGDRTRRLVKVRRQFVLRALSDGYTGVAIARFLNISETTISVIRTTAKLRVA